MINVLREILSHIDRRRQRRIAGLLVLLVAGGFAELLSIGSILPFLTAISSPDGPANAAYSAVVRNIFGVGDAVSVVGVMMGVFALLAVASAALQLAIIYFGQKYVLEIASDISVKVYEKLLRQPYSYYLDNNNSELLATISKGQQVSGQFLLPVLRAVSSFVIALFIVVGLAVARPVAALVSISLFSLLYVVVIAFTRKILLRQGEIIARSHSEGMHVATEGFGGIRDVLLDRSQTVFVNRFEAVDARVRRAQVLSGFFSEFPRYVVEGVAIVAIAVLAVLLSMTEGGLVSAVPVVAMMAAATLRLVPLVQAIFRGWAAFMTGGRILEDVLAVLRMPDHPPPGGVSELPFERDVTLRHMSFCYAGRSSNVIDALDLKIPKGARVGLIGKTGVGKSTLTDILMGLLSPTAGDVLIDGVVLDASNAVAWRRHVAHVPQHIYLADAPLSENIAFGVAREEIDMERVAWAAEQAQLADVVQGLSDGFATRLGERGVRLSGGQRQRVGIARALYRQADFLVLDEATSALDSETESEVMDAIARLDAGMTLVMIAHRQTTLQKCDFIVHLTPEGAVIERPVMA